MEEVNVSSYGKFGNKKVLQKDLSHTSILWFAAVAFKLLQSVDSFYALEDKKS